MGSGKSFHTFTVEGRKYSEYRLVRQYILTLLLICLVLWVCRVPTVFGINSANNWGVLL